jgi:hypothetical protein
MWNIINPLNAELYPISRLLSLLGAQTILHVSRIRVKNDVTETGWRARTGFVV